jgi:hypothetical protein
MNPERGRSSQEIAAHRTEYTSRCNTVNPTHHKQSIDRAALGATLVDSLICPTASEGRIGTGDGGDKHCTPAWRGGRSLKRCPVRPNSFPSVLRTAPLGRQAPVGTGRDEYQRASADRNTAPALEPCRHREVDVVGRTQTTRWHWPRIVRRQGAPQVPLSQQESAPDDGPFRTREHGGPFHAAPKGR